ncbi:MAG TPA: tetratricopeptide repeat protein [Abditibacteriaceae bacterium]|jgi:tetratricopeptide (TPR) repeat protein
MKKLILSLLLTACFILGGQAQEPAVLQAQFNENIGRARQYEDKQPGVALEYYKRALKAAQDDVQKADAQLGIGKTTPLRPKAEAGSKGDNPARLAAFQAAFDLPGASVVQKLEARIGIGQTQQFGFEQYEAALAHFEAVAGDAGAQADQKGRAILGSGETLMSLKRYDEARTRLTQFLAANTAPTTDAWQKAQRTLAHQLIARSYLQQENPRMALVTMKKAVAPTLPDLEASQAYLSYGDFFRGEKQPALARALYEMIPTLANAPGQDNGKALVQIGMTYADEKNYGKAREIWSFVPETRGAAINHIGDGWYLIGLSYSEEKNWDKAREAFGKWRDAADLPTKVRAWETIASTFLEEKKYAEARNALTGIGSLGANMANLHDKTQLNLRQKIGTAQIYRAEANFAQAATLYKEILMVTPISDSQPSYYHDAHKQVKAAADLMAKTPASMDAAYAVYEAWEAHYPYNFNKGEANMAMGDILAAQGKKEEAKAKYQKVIELRKTYDEAKIAQQKIDKLDGKVAN